MQAGPGDIDFRIDGDQLRNRLTALTRGRSGDGSSSPVRAEALALLKSASADARAGCEQQLFADGKGTKCAQRISDAQDELIQVIYDFAVTHVYRNTNASHAEKMAICAVGGYGRGTLAPGSDIDLLFVLPHKQTAWGESIVEYILYMLWDMGFKVGHATRNVEEAIRLSLSDMTIRTSILEARFLWGERSLFDQMMAKYQGSVVKGSKSDFITAKLAERDERHARAGSSRYLVEPNIKDGKGGMRDLHTLFWIGKYFYQVGNRLDLVAAGAFSRREYNMFRKAEDFLWAVRCHMHFCTGKSEERLTFELQPEMAQRLNYKAHAGLKSVERFMRHYFLVAKDVGNLTRVFCAQLEEKNAKQAPGLGRLVRSMRRRRRKIRGIADFVNENGRINVADEGVFERDPVNLIVIFKTALDQQLDIHPKAMELINASLRRLTKKVRWDRRANKIFMEILTAGEHSETMLRKMNECGVLGRFIRDFGRIVAMMQFNMYHHYTVDEHLLRTVGVYWEIRIGEMAEELPLSNQIVHEIKRPDILYLALLLHDIAKGRAEDHSIAGAKIVQRLGPRFGLDASDTELLSWLVREHLTMSNTAQSRDLADRKTIQDFAAVVQSVDRLRYLLLLTVCDIRAVGPAVWNGWKGQLIRTLYYEAEPVLTGGFTTGQRDSQVELAKQALASKLGSWSNEARDQTLDLPYPAYYLSTAPNTQIRQMELIRACRESGDRFGYAVHSSKFEAITEISVLAPDHPRLLSIIAGACASTGANIADAKIHTLRDGSALDTIAVSRELPDQADEIRRAERICERIRAILSGDKTLLKPLARPRKYRLRRRTFSVASKAEIDNAISNRFSVIELEGFDRPGLLHELTGKMTDLNLNVASAHIATFGEKIVDTFYVTDLMGDKITAKPRINTIRKRLIAVLEDLPYANAKVA